jgi:hypothetical protein
MTVLRRLEKDQAAYARFFCFPVTQAFSEGSMIQTTIGMRHGALVVFARAMAENTTTYPMISHIV